MTIADDKDAALSALYQWEVARSGVRKQASADQAQVRERGLIAWLLNFANPPAETGAPDSRDEIARRVAGWLQEIYRNRTHPDRLDVLRRRMFRSWASEAQQVDVAPAFALDKGRIRVMQALIGGRQPAMIAYAMLVLLDDERPYLNSLGCCKVCGQFFLLPEDRGVGRPERGYCSPEHKELFRKADQRERQARVRRGETRKARRKP